MKTHTLILCNSSRQISCATYSLFEVNQDKTLTLLPAHQSENQKGNL